MSSGDNYYSWWSPRGCGLGSVYLQGARLFSVFVKSFGGVHCPLTSLERQILDLRQFGHIVAPQHHPSAQLHSRPPGAYVVGMTSRIVLCLGDLFIPDRVPVSGATAKWPRQQQVLTLKT